MLNSFSSNGVLFVFFFNDNICVNRTGGALKTNISLDELPEISVENTTVHDTIDDSEGSEENSATDKFPFSDTIQVVGEEDIIGHCASIIYHCSL